MISWIYSIPKAQVTKEKIDKLDFMKKIFKCTSKNTINRVKRQLTEWEKIFVNCISDKGSISKIYRETPKTPQQKPKQPDSKMGKGFK